LTTCIPTLEKRGGVMLFRLELVPENMDESNLGYEWIEVLAVTPHWLSPRDDGQFHVSHAFIARTECGPAVVVGDDLWPEIEAGVYREVSKESGQ
jgi:hypothetical protein